MGQDVLSSKELTLMVNAGKPKCVASHFITLINKIHRDWLQGKCHARSCGSVDCQRLFPPKGMDVFVKLGIDLGACAAVIMTTVLPISLDG